MDIDGKEGCHADQAKNGKEKPVPSPEFERVGGADTQHGKEKEGGNGGAEKDNGQQREAIGSQLVVKEAQRRPQRGGDEGQAVSAQVG